MSDEEVDPELLKAVGADEVLHRRILFDANHYAYADGRWQLTSMAFAEKSGHPSVDRRLLRPDATKTQDGELNAVVRLSAAQVRAIAGVIEMDKKGRPVGDAYAIDVHPEPVDGNASHAEIRPSPAFKIPRLREKLQKALQRIVNDAADPWVIPVWETRQAGGGG